MPHRFTVPLSKMGETACLGPFLESQSHYWAPNHCPINLTHVILILSPAKTLRVEKNFPSLHQALVGGSESPQGEDLTSHHLHPNLWPWGALRRLGRGEPQLREPRIGCLGQDLHCAARPSLKSGWAWDHGARYDLLTCKNPLASRDPPVWTPFCFKASLTSQSC